MSDTAQKPTSTTEPLAGFNRPCGGPLVCLDRARNAWLERPPMPINHIRPGQRAARGQSSASTDTDLREWDCPHNRGRPQSAPHPGSYANREGQGLVAGHATQAQSPSGSSHGRVLLKSGEYSTAELGDLFGVARSTVYRAIGREACALRMSRKPIPLRNGTIKASQPWNGGIGVSIAVPARP